MKNQIFTLTYVSTASSPFSLVELGALTRQCQIHNNGIGVTGILVYREPNIFQILEGDERMVWDLYRRIVDDPRHHDVVEMWTEVIARRRYPQWSMNLITDGELHDVLGADFTAADLRAAVPT